jgi:hypothetical protein
VVVHVGRLRKEMHRWSSVVVLPVAMVVVGPLVGLVFLVPFTSATHRWSVVLVILLVLIKAHGIGVRVAVSLPLVIMVMVTTAVVLILHVRILATPLIRFTSFAMLMGRAITSLRAGTILLIQVFNRTQRHEIHLLEVLLFSYISLSHHVVV